MTPGAELRRLKSEITSFDCLNFEDLKFYTEKIANHIRKISSVQPSPDDLLQDYIETVILKHLAIIEEFVNHLKQYRGREEFVSKALRYHFNCIIDSYTYASLAYHQS
ncbi:MAG: hypothetical protein ACJ75B_00975 [Flavisolibacter sp.]